MTALLIHIMVHIIVIMIIITTVTLGTACSIAVILDGEGRSCWACLPAPKFDIEASVCWWLWMFPSISGTEYFIIVRFCYMIIGT